MRLLDRREMLKTTGAGTAVAVGLGGAGVGGVGGRSAPTSEPEVTNSFVATGQGGYILINQSVDPTDPFPLPTSNDPNIDQDIKVWGEVYSDGTWEETDVQFPNIVIPEDEIPIDLPLGDIELFVTPIERPYTGEFIRDSDDQLFTIDGSIELDFPPEIKDLLDLDPIDVDLEMTTGVSNQMEGDIEGLDTQSATGTVVDNSFPVNETGEDLIDDTLGLPSTQGENEISITMTVDISPPPIGESDSPPIDIDGDGLYENVSGSGEFGIHDVQLLFENLDSERVQQNADIFNFSGSDPDHVTIFDVQSLFKRLPQPE